MQSPASQQLHSPIPDPGRRHAVVATSETCPDPACVTGFADMPRTLRDPRWVNRPHRTVSVTPYTLALLPVQHTTWRLQCADNSSCSTNRYSRQLPPKWHP